MSLGRGPWRRSRTARAAVPDGYGERGMVTAELAMALPALVLATLVAITGVQVLCAQLRALDAAAVAARLAARGEQPAAVTAAATQACAAARLHLQVVGGTVVAEADVSVAPVGIRLLLPAFVVRERAVYALEPPAGA